MTKVLSTEAVARYRRDGFYFPVPVLSKNEARGYRDKLEAHERVLGGRSPRTCATRCTCSSPGPTSSPTIRRSSTPSRTSSDPTSCAGTPPSSSRRRARPPSCHGTRTRPIGGSSTDDVITAWVAFADAPVESGAMKFWPGSHLKKQLEHRDTFDKDNLLTRGQEIAVEVPDGRRRRRGAEGRRDVAASRPAGRTGRAPTRPTTAASASPSATSRPMCASSRSAIRRCWCAASTATAISTWSRGRRRSRRRGHRRPCRCRRPAGQSALLRHRSDRFQELTGLCPDLGDIGRYRAVARTILCARGACGDRKPYKQYRENGK